MATQGEFDQQADGVYFHQRRRDVSRGMEEGFNHFADRNFWLSDGEGMLEALRHCQVSDARQGMIGRHHGADGNIAAKGHVHLPGRLGDEAKADIDSNNVLMTLTHFKSVLLHGKACANSCKSAFAKMRPDIMRPDIKSAFAKMRLEIKSAFAKML